MFKYILKRIGLLLVTFVIIMFICFVLIKTLPLNFPEGLTKAQQEVLLAKWTALGYYDPIVVQFAKYVKNIVTQWNWGYSWTVDGTYWSPFPAWDSLTSRIGPTMLINIYSILFSVPLGIGLGIYAALKKNKWQDNFISVMIMVFVSVPSYIYAFLVQYLLCYKLGWFPLKASSLADAGNSYFSGTMFVSLLPAVLSLSFGTVAGLARFVRAELTESLTSEYMLLARAKGLTNAQATMRHALNNAMVPVLPSILAEFIDVIGGSLIIEQIFVVPGVGGLFIKAINMKDYDVYMVSNAFYVFIGLAASILIDLSYGFIDPRIRMGER
jgi:oligopeptide transport system permease protein